MGTFSLMATFTTSFSTYDSPISVDVLGLCISPGKNTMKYPGLNKIDDVPGAFYNVASTFALYGFTLVASSTVAYWTNSEPFTTM